MTSPDRSTAAVGYLLKSTTSEALLPMLRAVMRGESAISGTMVARILEEFGRLTTQPPSRTQEGVPGITAREREVLGLVADGASDKEIAAELCVSLSTVKTHVRNVLAKLQATSRHQTATYAVREGLIRPPGQEDVRGEH